MKNNIRFIPTKKWRNFIIIIYITLINSTFENLGILSKEHVERLSNMIILLFMSFDRLYTKVPLTLLATPVINIIFIYFNISQLHLKYQDISH